MSDEQFNALLDKVDPDTCAMLKSIILSTVFAEPVIASFPIDGLTLSSNLAMSGNAGAFDAF